MLSFSCFFLASLAVVGALAYPSRLSKRLDDTGYSGTDAGGMLYSFWTSGGGGPVSYDHATPGEFSVTWTDPNDFVCGKGWPAGSGRAISYYADSFVAGELSMLSVYGYLINPTIEYYIVENYGNESKWNNAAFSWTGSGIENHGTVTTDGGVYDIYRDYPINPYDAVPGTRFTQFWSVRRSVRFSGTVNVQAHLDAWAAQGMVVDPSPRSQIVAVEGQTGIGSAQIRVAEGYVDLSPSQNPPSSQPAAAASSSSPPAAPTSSPSPPAAAASSSSQPAVPTLYSGPQAAQEPSSSPQAAAASPTTPAPEPASQPAYPTWHRKGHTHTPEAEPAPSDDCDHEQHEHHEHHWPGSN